MPNSPNRANCRKAVVGPSFLTRWLARCRPRTSAGRPQSHPAGTRRWRTAACLPAAGSRVFPLTRTRAGKASRRLPRAHPATRLRAFASPSRTRRERIFSARFCASTGSAACLAARPPPAAWTRCWTRWSRRGARRPRSRAPARELPRVSATTSSRSGAPRNARSGSDRDPRRRATTTTRRSPLPRNAKRAAALLDITLTARGKSGGARRARLGHSSRRVSVDQARASLAAFAWTAAAPNVIDGGGEGGASRRRRRD